MPHYMQPQEGDAGAAVLTRRVFYSNSELRRRRLYAYKTEMICGRYPGVVSSHLRDVVGQWGGPSSEELMHPPIHQQHTNKTSGSL